MNHNLERRLFLKWSALTAGITFQTLIFSPFAWAKPGVPPQINTTSADLTNTQGVFNQAEEQTQLLLNEIEHRLHTYLDDEDFYFSDDLRMVAIRLAMCWPFSGIAQSSLETLGDSAEAREDWAFFMPIVKWMSEPFLFPVETTGSPKEQTHEMKKIFNLMNQLER